MTLPKEKDPPGEGGPKLRGRQQEESPGKDKRSLCHHQALCNTPRL